jgi:hypothetical protein
MDLEALNAPRWTQAKDGFNEAWYVVASEPKAGLGLWVRYAVDIDDAGAPTFALWGSWFERGRAFALRNLLAAAAIGRTGVEFGAAGLTAEACSGEVEAGGHSLRWRLAFGRDSAEGEEAIPGWLLLPAKLRGSGFVLPHPAATVTGAVEVDGRLIELQRAPAGQAHLWGKRRWPAWAWARCNAFAEDPGAAVDLLDVQGPAGVRVPIFIFRFRGQVHRFGELPWIARSLSRPSSPAWHFAAQDGRIALEGVVRAEHDEMVQVQYADPDGSLHHCCNSEIASMELRVRSRPNPFARWRPEATLTSRGACLEFCGQAPDPRVKNSLVTAEEKRARTAAVVAS